MKSNKTSVLSVKYSRLFLLLKLTIACYLAIFSISYLTSDTAAYFTSKATVSQIITAGTWETEPEKDELIAACNEDIDIIQEENSIVNEECGSDEDAVVTEIEDGTNETLDEELDNPVNTSPEADSNTNPENNQEKPSEDTETKPDVSAPPVTEKEEQKPDNGNSTEQNASQDDKAETAPANTDNKKVEGDKNEETESDEVGK